MYTKGDVTLLDHPKILAIVGSREAPDASLLWARHAAQDAAESGWVIISGLAKGCDLAGHLGCYKGKGRTIGVIATDFDHYYPPEHEKLQRWIGDHDLLLSLTPPGKPLRAGRFVMRNNLIAHYAHAVLVPWAEILSGSRHVVSAGLREGKPLFLGPHCPEHRWMEGRATRISAWEDLELPPTPCVNRPIFDFLL